jgi:DNA topoisomerase-1
VGQENSSKDTGVSCFEPGCTGTIVEKTSKRGKIFYGCSRYPDCDFASWDRPVDRKCPECGSVFLVEKENKREGKFLKCPNRDCRHKEKVTQDPETD